MMHPMRIAAQAGQMIFDLGQLEVKLRIWQYRHELLRRPGRVVGQCDCGSGPIVEHVRKLKRYNVHTLKCHDCGAISELKITKTRLIQTAIDTRIERGLYLYGAIAALEDEQRRVTVLCTDGKGVPTQRQRAEFEGMRIYRRGRRSVVHALLEYRHRLLGRPPGRILGQCPCGAAVYLHTSETTSPKGKTRRKSLVCCHDCGYKQRASDRKKLGIRRKK
jgi:hypothetical protein